MSERSIMSQRSIEYNNAGVDCTEAGQHRMAWDLFKGALEVKLTLERIDGSIHSIESRAGANCYIAKAEAHLCSLTSWTLKDSAIFSCLGLKTSTSMQSRETWEASPRRESAAIIFNLALVDHLKSRSSEQAVALYELAMTLLTGATVDLLGVALMNNIGVWCYENGDLDGSLKCMAHLHSFSCAADCEMGSEQRDGLQSNMLWLTNPPFAASPAA
jgi:hypothetical protein